MEKNLWKKIIPHLIVTLLAIVLWTEALYVANESVLFAWDRATEGTVYETYEVGALWEGPTGVRQEYNIGETEETQMLIKRPRTGFFTFKVRAKIGDEVSDWSLSTDPNIATVDGVPRGWRVFFDITAPSGGGII